MGATKPPFFGGIQAFFPNPPEIGIHFVGAAKVAQIPGLSSIVRSSIANAVANICVLPRRIAIDMDDEDEVNLVEMRYPEPISILRLTLYSGSGLMASDVHMFREASSDPYVVATLGCKTWTSPTIKNSLNPTWGSSDGITVDFYVHNHGQELKIKVFDYDFGSADDLIGIATPMDFDETRRRGLGCKASINLLKPTGEPGKFATGGGQLTVMIQHLELCTTRPEASSLTSKTTDAPSVAHISAKVLRVGGLPDDAQPPFKVRVRILSDNGPTTIIEDSTNVGFPQPVQQLACSVDAKREALHSVCASLLNRGYSIEKAAEILDLQETQVHSYLASKSGAEKVEEAMRATALAKLTAAAERAPCFDEVLQMLVPRLGDRLDELIELAVIDSKQHCHGFVRASMAELIGAPGSCMQIPASNTVQGKEPLVITGDLLFRWLV